MPDNFHFVMAGGGTGGHVIPLLAVARELRLRGDECTFVGTARGAESRLVPAEGFPLELIRIGGLQGVGVAQKLQSLVDLVCETWKQFQQMGRRRPAAVFSLGGYVAGPPVLGAILRGVPVVVMEPNAVPGLTNRWIGRFVRRALINFPETARYFTSGRTEVTGLPVREEFFHIPARVMAVPFTILITGGSQGALTLNRAAQAAWPKLRELGTAIYVIHQTGVAHFEMLRPEFESSGVNGELVPFIADMPSAYARADLIICRSGAGAVSELAASGKPSVLIPYPYAADDHQRHNAEQFRKAGAAMLFGNAEWNGHRMMDVIQQLWADPQRLQRMSDAARSIGQHVGSERAARRAADILEGVARESR